MLTQRYSADQVRAALVPAGAWRPVPTIGERVFWDSLPSTIRAGYAALAAELEATPWPHLLASRYLVFRREGERQGYLGSYYARRRKLGGLVLAECMEGRGRLLDAIADGIWLICEESSWCVPGHVHAQRAGVDLPDTTEPIVDLMAAETAAALSWSLYLLEDRLDEVSSLITPRVQREVQERVLGPCLARDDFWWMGNRGHAVNNWNPWIVSNWLDANLLCELDPERRHSAVMKAMRCLDRFLDTYPEDGGCDEGPTYWGRAGGSLLDCLEQLVSATGGIVDLYDEPLVQEIGRYIYRMQIAGRYVVNFADGSALLVPPPMVVMTYGRRIGDPLMQALGAWAARESDILCESTPPNHGGGFRDLRRAMRALVSLDELQTVEASPPLPRDAWMPAIQVMTARERAGSSEGFFVAAKGGHNGESHNHNDVGQFIVYRDGLPILVDVGVEQYRAQTFSPQRYEIWTMQSSYHNLPTINGAQQLPGAEYTGRVVHYRGDDAVAELVVDMAAAYDPDAKLASWRRKVTLNRGDSVILRDRYEVTEPVREITLSLLTPCQVDLSEDGFVALRSAPLPDGRVSGSARIKHDRKRFEASAEDIRITDANLASVWGDHLTRIVLRFANPPTVDKWLIKITPS